MLHPSLPNAPFPDAILDALDAVAFAIHGTLAADPSPASGAAPSSAWPLPSPRDLPLATISNALRRLGAPLSPTTGPLYLASHLPLPAAASGPTAATEAGQAAADARAAPEQRSVDYRRLVRRVASKHLLDMLVASGGRLDASLASALAARPGQWATVSHLGEAVAEVLVGVAEEHATAGRLLLLADERDVAARTLLASVAAAMAAAAEAWVADLINAEAAASSSSSSEPGGGGGGLRARVRQLLAGHLRRGVRSRRVATACRSEAAARAHLWPLPGTHDYDRHNHDDRHVHKRGGGNGGGGQRSSGNTRQGRSDRSEDDDDSRGAAEGAEGDKDYGADYLHDSMCYFIIGNLHRVRAELNDRTGPVGGSTGKDSCTAAALTVRDVVRALQVGAACTYPPQALATLLAAVTHYQGNVEVSSDGGGSTTWGGDEAWDLPVDLSTLESQLDDHLMDM